MTDNWEASALCAQVDPDLFFPEKGGNVDDAVKVCQRCDVRQQCLGLALALQQTERWTVLGVWGGTTVNDRRKMRRRVIDATGKERVLALVAKGRTATEAARLAGVHPRAAMRIVKEARAA